MTSDVCLSTALSPACPELLCSLSRHQCGCMTFPRLSCSLLPIVVLSVLKHPLRTLLSSFPLKEKRKKSCLKAVCSNIGISLLDQAKYLAPVCFRYWPTPVFNYSCEWYFFCSEALALLLLLTISVLTEAATFLLSASLCWFLIFVWFYISSNFKAIYSHVRCLEF